MLTISGKQGIQRELQPRRRDLLAEPVAKGERFRHQVARVLSSVGGHLFPLAQSERRNECPRGTVSSSRG